MTRQSNGVEYNARVVGAAGQGGALEWAAVDFEPYPGDDLSLLAREAEGVAGMESRRAEGQGGLHVSGPVAMLRALAARLQGAACGRALSEALRGFERTRLVLETNGRRLRIGPRALVMGILNVTPDSFSDGGRFFDPSRAVERGLAMRAEGADIVDVGGESTRPGALPVPAEEQIRRTAAVVERLAGQGVLVSIDTSSALVAREALDRGAAMVNDVTALRGDPAMAPLAAERKAPIVLMHMLGTPRTMQERPEYQDVVADVLRFLRERVRHAMERGIEEEQVLIDPGIGFGKTVEHNLTILRRLSEFRSLGRPVVVGASRKSFIGKVLDRPVEDRLYGSLSAAVLAVCAGAAVLRVHDVRPTLDAVRMAEAILGRTGAEEAPI